MISINLKNITYEKLTEINSLATSIGDSAPDQEAKEISDEMIEDIIGNYLLTCNDNKVALTQCLAHLRKEEVIELLALYYFFSKITYDSVVITDEDMQTFWGQCITNAESDIARLGLDTMTEFLKEKTNLGTILSTALLNLKD